MKDKTLFCLLLTLAICFTGCKKNSIVGEPNNKPYFYVKYHGDHWATVKFDKYSTMTITDEKGEQKSYSIGRRDVIIGPVYVGFKASLTISAPYDGGNDGSISIARNSDFYFTNYGSFANAKDEETITYTISETTGL